MKIKISLLLFILLVNSAVFGSTDKSSAIYSQKFVSRIMQDVFNWQLNNPVQINESTQYWARSVFYSGVMYAYNSTPLITTNSFNKSCPVDTHEGRLFDEK